MLSHYIVGCISLAVGIIIGARIVEWAEEAMDRELERIHEEYGTLVSSHDDNDNDE